MRELTTVRVSRRDAPEGVAVTAETTENDHLVVTPHLHHTQDGDWGFGHGYAVTHVPTGRSVSPDPYGQCDLPTARRFARAIAKLGDWSFTDPEHFQTEAGKPLADAVRKARREVSEVTAPNPDDVSDEAPDEAPKTAAKAVPDAVRYAQGAWERWHLGLPEKDGTRTKVDFRNEDGSRNELYFQLLHVALQSFSVAYLMAALQRMDPRGADSAIRWLHETQEGGEGVGEFLWEWNRAVENGEPLNLPGVMPYIDPDAPILAPVTA